MAVFVLGAIRASGWRRRVDKGVKDPQSGMGALLRAAILIAVAG